MFSNRSGIRELRRSRIPLSRATRSLDRARHRFLTRLGLMVVVLAALIGTGVLFVSRTDFVGRDGASPSARQLASGPAAPMPDQSRPSVPAPVSAEPQTDITALTTVFGLNDAAAASARTGVIDGDSIPPSAITSPDDTGDGVRTNCVSVLAQTALETTLFFPSGSTWLQPEHRGALTRLREAARACPGVQLEIAGHTDDAGDELTNLELSWERADAVAKFLAEDGLGTDQFHTLGYGAKRPVAANNSAEARAQNRRVEFAIR